MVSENTSDTNQAKVSTKTDVSGSALLNGKAKIHFINWFNNLQIVPCSVMFDDLPIIVQQAYIKDWLFNIGIYITNGCSYFKEEGYFFDASIHYGGECKETNSYDTPIEAIIKAIEKANDIYNYSIKADR